MEFEHLYEDGELTVAAKLWYLDVVDGRVALLPAQHPDFFHLMSLRRDGHFYDSYFEAFMIEYPRAQALFALMANEAGE